MIETTSAKKQTLSEIAWQTLKSLRNEMADRLYPVILAGGMPESYQWFCSADEYARRKAQECANADSFLIARAIEIARATVRSEHAE